MKCSEAHLLITDQMEGGLTPPAQSRLDSHLAGCPKCRARLKEQRTLAMRLGHTLRALSDQVETRPDAWSRLQNRLGQQRVLPNFRLLDSFALSLTLVGMLFVGMLSINAMLPQRRVSAITTPLVIPPLVVYMPSDRSVTPDSWRLVTGRQNGMLVAEYRMFYRGGKFAILTQKPVALAADLPEGKAVMINGAPGVMVEGLSNALQIGNHVFLDGILRDHTEMREQGICPDAHFLVYERARALYWTAGGIRFELVTILPKDAMMALANSLEPTSLP